MEKFSLQQNGLLQQGYCTYSSSKLNSISNGLRFTPLVCMFLAIFGLLVLQSPAWHFGIAALGIIPFWFPNAHPLDVFYNSVISPIFKAEKLPANPLPRRIACLMGGLMNLGIAFGFLYGNVTLAYIFGAVLVVLQLVVITTHICVASMMYEGILKLLGKYEGPVAVTDAHKLIADGYQLVDVRSPKEFEEGKLTGAINIPLDILDTCDYLPAKGAVVYCKSGMRSLDAVQRLKAAGYTNVVNFGAMGRWG